jgi:RNA polymerase sigma-70 factor (ECF subfamily)
LHEPLRDHFRLIDGVEVVVERRVGERRVSTPRRIVKGEAAAPDVDRRTVRTEAGRRVADRRAIAITIADAPTLPRQARRYAARLTFVERLAPAEQLAKDIDSKRLVVRFQAGDAAVFGELYLRYFDQIYSYARVALEDHHEAEDATQHIFLRALSALDRYEARANVPFRGWLFAIARNVIIDVLKRRHGLQVEPPALLDTMRDENPEQREAAVETLGWLTDREVAMFVERLPLAQRQVLVLRFMLDLSGDEIASVLGRSTTAVRKLQSRALQALQERLARVGRTSSRQRPVPMFVRIKPLPVIVNRRFGLGHGRVGRRTAV